MGTRKPDLSMATNNWVINNPKWNDENAPKWKCTKESHWYIIYGTDYFLRMTKNNDRVAFEHYCKDEHFYYLYWDCLRYDIIFASYDINEIIRFAKKLITTKTWLTDLFVFDVVTKEHYVFVTNDCQHNWRLSTLRGYKTISLGEHEFINERKGDNS